MYSKYCSGKSKPVDKREIFYLVRYLSLEPRMNIFHTPVQKKNMFTFEHLLGAGKAKSSILFAY